MIFVCYLLDQLKLGGTQFQSVVQNIMNSSCGRPNSVLAEQTCGDSSEMLKCLVYSSDNVLGHCTMWQPLLSQDISCLSRCLSQCTTDLQITVVCFRYTWLNLCQTWV